MFFEDLQDFQDLPLFTNVNLSDAETLLNSIDYEIKEYSIKSISEIDEDLKDTPKLERNITNKIIKKDSCPLCIEQVKAFHINFHQLLFMCSNPKCNFPLNESNMMQYICYKEDVDSRKEMIYEELEKIRQFGRE